MGQSIRRTIDKVWALKARVKDLYSAAVSFRLTDEQLHERKARLLYGTTAYKGLPQWAKAEIRGYDEASFDAFYKYELGGRWELDGVVYDKETADSSEAFREATRGEMFRVRYLGMFYKGTDRHYTGGDCHVAFSGLKDDEQFRFEEGGEVFRKVNGATSYGKEVFYKDKNDKVFEITTDDPIVIIVK